jgi:quinol monooxygenase YgiN
MDMDKFAMYGKFTTVEGERDNLVQILLEAAELLKSYEGCELYIINVSDEHADAIWVTELWKDAEAHAESLKLEGILPLLQRGKPLIAGVEPIKLRSVGGKVG